MEILRADRDGNVILPTGQKVDAAMADVLGYVVMGGRAPTVEAKAEAAATVAAAKARAGVLHPQAAAPEPVEPRPLAPRMLERPTRAPIPRATSREALKRGAMGMAGMVELPCGRVESVEAAMAAGYVVEGTPAAARALAQAEVDARFDAVLSLPEATGRFAAARQFAAAGIDTATATRMLRAMPLDEVDEPTVAAPPATVDPHAARRLQIEAAGAAYRKSRGRA